MSAEQDAGNNGKKLTSIIGLLVLLVLGGGYWLMSWLTHDNRGTDSAVNLNGTATSAGTTTAETPRYRELLKASNDKGAADATRNSTSFIASLPVGLETREQPPEKPPARPSQPVPPPTEPPGGARVSTAEQQQANEKRKEQLQKLLTRISANRNSGTIPVRALSTATVDERETAGRSQIPTTLTTASLESQQQFIPALTRVSGFLETAVDSDNTTSQVVAVIPAGTLAGARLHSSSVKLAGEGVEIHFSRMSWQGMELNINAWAQREDNLMSSVASDVNHRWGSHIVLPAILSGIGDLGGLYKDANTQILQTNVSTVSGRVGKPDASSVAGVMVGGTAQKGAEVISQEVAREPYRQVTVKQNEVISILFVDAVGSDSLTSQKGPSAASSAGGNLPASAAEQLTETRLQEAISRRQAEIRRQYGGTDPRKE